jgi:hypothetical protein
MTNIYCVSDLYIKISVTEMGGFIEERYKKRKKNETFCKKRGTFQNVVLQCTFTY